MPIALAARQRAGGEAAGGHVDQDIDGKAGQQQRAGHQWRNAEHLCQQEQKRDFASGPQQILAEIAAGIADGREFRAQPCSHHTRLPTHGL